MFYFLRLSSRNNTLRLINLHIYYKDKTSLKEKLKYSFMTDENKKTNQTNKTCEVNENITYYNPDAQRFYTDTKDIDFTAIRKKFLDLSVANGLILDFGNCSEHDTRYFLSKNFTVEAIDSSENTNINVRLMDFTNLVYKKLL